ncbi:MAG: amidohydrolase family protein [Alphaproteobacteria bacterium]|nr:amidohydrolase family protein [Alphaproteobacteria bacterium]
MPDILLTDCTLLDSRTLKLASGATILVRGGRIAEIGDKSMKAPGAETVACGGRIVMPGLVDGHVHCTAMAASLGALRTLPTTLVAAATGSILRGMLQRGFTSVRDAGGADHGIAKAVEQGYFQGPRVYYSGRAISQTGGHGDFRDFIDYPGADMGEPCGCAHLLAGIGRIADGVAEVRRAARDEIRFGATQIKVMASGGVASPADPITFTQYSMEELRALVEEAEAAETYVMAHAYTPRAIKRCVEAGVRTIEHGNLMDADTAKLMAKHGAYLVATLSTYDALSRRGKALGFPEIGLQRLALVVKEGIEALKLAKAAGVKVVYGSDLLGAMHEEQSNEFSLRSPVYSAAELVQQATWITAEAMKRTHEIGCIQKGAYADLLVVDGNPMERIELLQDQGKHLKAIMKSGAFAKNEL